MEREAEAKNKVFIVHGHDNELKLEVCLFLTELGLKPVILHQQPSRGKTIKEKLDEYTDVDYGIVLYTPCDLGRAITEKELKFRPRMNVVFEHGKLEEKLGRERIAMIVKGNVDFRAIRTERYGSVKITGKTV